VEQGENEARWGEMEGPSKGRDRLTKEVTTGKPCWLVLVGWGRARSTKARLGTLWGTAFAWGRGGVSVTGRRVKRVTAARGEGGDGVVSVVGACQLSSAAS
jgi:hypothetical protein